LIASVIVNGQYCGFSKAPCAKWDCDITSAVKVGAVNEICVGIKDVYYAISKTGDGKSARYMFNLPTERFYNDGGLSSTRYADFPVLFHVRASGILEAPSLIACGQVYTSDVFAIPSVSKGELGLEISVTNPTSVPVDVEISNEVAPLNGGAPEKTFAVQKIAVPGGEELTIKLAEAWVNPRLWWPDAPQQYCVLTKLVVAGKQVDVKRTKFGFREWQWDGKSFRLNGVPWNMRADLTHSNFPGGSTIKNPEEAVAQWRKNGQNMFRYWSYKPWTGESQKDTLDFFDAHGVPVRRSGIFDGEMASYMLVEEGVHKALFDNWIHQLKAWVKAERNHPSIFIWSLENEITYINARNFGWLNQVEPEITRAADAVMTLDPTRPVMVDGGDALRDRSLPVYGNHYNEFPMREYPDEAYTFVKAYRRHEYRPDESPWSIGSDKPLFLGESFFASGFTPSAYSQLSGDVAFLGWQQARHGVGWFAKMLSEGYRWHGVAAFHFWLGPDRADLHYNSWQPVCVLCREWNWTFGSQQTIQRTLKVFNDTRYSNLITMGWQFNVANSEVASGKEVFSLPPGTAKETNINFTAPKVQTRTQGELILTCHRDGKEVFREVKPIWLIKPDAAPLPNISKSDLVVWDAHGTVKKRLGQRGIRFTEITAFESIPNDAKVLVVGTDALTPRQATDPRWQVLALDGMRILVLDQQNPLHYQAVPADLEVTEHIGRVAFSENLEHPAMAGLDQPDFFTWSKDHIVYRNAYKKASKGAKSLVQCDNELSYTALAECVVGDGLLLLCQLAVGSKLDVDPVAQRLFDNMVNYCVDYKLPAKRTGVVIPPDEPRAKLLAESGLRMQSVSNAVNAISDNLFDIVIADATPQNLKQLAGAADSLKSFTNQGGWLMLWGLTPEGLADFNTIVGQHHVIRPFQMERVTLPALRAPVLAGLTMRDVVLESGEKIFPWSGDRYPSKDTFSYVVDLNDIAPFCSAPSLNWAWTQMTNGLVSADAWVFIFSHELSDNPKPIWSATLPKEEEILEFSIVPNTFYHHMTKMLLIFDGDESVAVELDLKPVMERQDFAIIPPRKAKNITLKPIAWDEVGSKPVVSVENIWIRVRRSEDFKRMVTPLLNIGALVQYRQGNGGILLNNVKVLESESVPVNSQNKRTIVTTLLRNLGAVFAGEKPLVAGSNLKYHPIKLGDKCNQYLTTDRGWLDFVSHEGIYPFETEKSDFDLGHLPVGENRFAGVTYSIRDFKTSPLPSCIMLAGHPAKGQLPESVEGIPVREKADVLFFLHAFHHTEWWESPRWSEPEEPPILFKYVVCYADGKTADIPVVYGRGVGHWITDEPRGLPEATVAWAAPFPQNPDNRQAVVYQMSWKNPRPETEITSIDITYEKASKRRYGVPAVFAVTAGTIFDSHRRPESRKKRSHLYNELPDISTFADTKSDRFIADMEDVTGGHPFKGINSNKPHGGAHIYFDNTSNTWPQGGTNPENYPPIYASTDGIITRIDYCFRQRKGNDRYGLDLSFAKDKDGSVYRLCYSIEPMIPQPSEGFYKTFIVVEEGQKVKKGDVIAYMYMPPGVEHVHIHFHIKSFPKNKDHFMAPAIFTPPLVKQFYSKWKGFRKKDGDVQMPACMGYKLGTHENPFGTGAVEKL